MTDEVDIHKERLLLLRKGALIDKKATLQRSGCHAIDGGKHAGLIVPPKRADFDGASVAKVLSDGIVG
jgi:hypothetical protein